jgi:periplasmic divalent cation tolerance protein
MLRVVLCNCSPEESEDLARGLVDSKNAACVNVISGIHSCYTWEGEVCEETEDTLLIKTTDEQYPAMKEWIEAHHSYDVPEIVALDVEDVHEPYLAWAEKQVGGGE